MTFGNLWILPSTTCIAQARTAVLRAEWGHNRAMRCPELVLGILRNPVRDDPLSAIIYRSICDLRRLIVRDTTKFNEFHYNLDNATKSYMDNIIGPAHGFIEMLRICGSHCDTDNHQIRMHSNVWPEPIHLTHGTDPVF